MPRKIVDLSARSRYLREEPFMAHFWECTPDEFLDYLREPRRQLAAMGIEIPSDCRIETTVENHDWIGEATKGLEAADGTIICNTGGGNIARSVYRVISYGHTQETVGKFDKRLLHTPEEEELQL